MPDENDIVYDTYGIDLIGLLQKLVDSIRSFFGFGDSIDGGGGIAGFLTSLGFWWEVYSIIAIIFSLFCLWGFIYAKIRYAQLVEVENEQLHEEEQAWLHAYGGGIQKNDRWGDIQSHIASENPNDWRLAIIEADVMLDQMLDDAGYVGVSIGDKLKTANPSSFQTVQDAWDAHRTRNEIAHAGSDFILTKRGAQETIVKYERVFREFAVI